MTARRMPSLRAVAAYWSERTQPWMRAWFIGWGEPFCFACGWLPPVPDGKTASWEMAGRWLDRAHLHDRVFGGSDEPSNIVPLCHLCHDDMPASRSAAEGLEWVRQHAAVESGFQVWTDGRLCGRVDPTRSTTLVRARMEYLDATRATADCSASA